MTAAAPEDTDPEPESVAQLKHRLDAIQLCLEDERFDRALDGLEHARSEVLKHRSQS